MNKMYFRLLLSYLLFLCSCSAIAQHGSHLETGILEGENNKYEYRSYSHGFTAFRNVNGKYVNVEANYNTEIPYIEGVPRISLDRKPVNEFLAAVLGPYLLALKKRAMFTTNVCLDKNGKIEDMDFDVDYNLFQKIPIQVFEKIETYFLENVVVNYKINLLLDGANYYRPGIGWDLIDIKNIYMESLSK